MQLPDTVNSANPLPDTYARTNSTSPRTPKSSSANGSPSGAYRSRRWSKTKTLEHTLPPLAVTPPLPEELPYVVSPKSAGSPRSPGPRPQLKVGDPTLAY